MQQIKKMFPDVTQQLAEFYAEKAGVKVEVWIRSIEVIISDNLYGMGDDVIDIDDAKAIVVGVINILPPMRESSWVCEESNTKFVEFSVSPEQLNIAYFQEVRKVLNAKPLLNK